MLAFFIIKRWFLQSFGEKLRLLREKHNLTIRDLAKKLGYTTHGYLGNIEKGRRKPSLELGFKIAQLFNIPLEDLANDNIEID